MSTVPTHVTINSASHNHILTERLWNAFKSNHGVDFDLVWCGRSIGVHRLLLDLFLSSDKLQQTAAALQQELNNDCNVLDLLLEFLYTGRVTVVREQLDNLQALATGADFSLLVNTLENEKRNNYWNGSHIAETEADSSREIKSKKWKTVPTRSRKNRLLEVDIDKSSTLICEPDIAMLFGAVSEKDCHVLPEGVEHSREDLLLIKQQRFKQPNQIKMELLDGELPTSTACQTSDFSVEVLELKQSSWSDLDQNLQSDDEPINAMSDSDQDTMQFRLVVPGSELVSDDLDENVQQLQSDAKLKSDKIGIADKKVYGCKFCEKVYGQRVHLRRHMKIHSGVKAHKCVICCKAFYSGYDLQRHQSCHSNEKPYPCSICQKAFKEAFKLRDHLRTHTGETPYQCGVCSKSFSRSFNLKVHLRTHTGEKPYKCSACQMAFAAKSNLRYHVRTRCKKLKELCKNNIPTSNTLITARKGAQWLQPPATSGCGH